MPLRTETLTIEHSHPGERLDTFLRRQFPATSRGAIQRLIEQGHITVNGQPTKPTHTPRAGEVVRIVWPEARTAEAQPEDIPLDVLFEDEALLVLNKPAGLVVHPAAGNEEHTLVNALLHHCAGELSGIGGVARPGIVHRLDKETSGCLVVAKNDETHVALSDQFAGRTVEKIYLAIVCGVLPRDEGNIRAAIARHPTHRKRMAVRDDDEGRAAHTGYRVRRTTSRSHARRGPTVHRSDAPNSRPLPAPRLSRCRRRHLWPAANQTPRGVDPLRSPARSAACAQTWVHSSGAPGSKLDLHSALAGGF